VGLVQGGDQWVHVGLAGDPGAPGSELVVTIDDRYEAHVQTGTPVAWPATGLPQTLTIHMDNCSVTATFSGATARADCNAWTGWRPMVPQATVSYLFVGVGTSVDPLGGPIATVDDVMLRAVP